MTEWIGGVTVLHAVRNPQREYSGRKRKNERQAETMCGRHFKRDRSIGGKAECLSCIRALNAS